MKQSLQLRLGQNLTMTPQLQQAIRMLQLSTLELQIEVQQALESNLMLEEITDDDEELNLHAPSEPTADNSDEPIAEPVEAAAVEGMEADTLPDELPVDSAWEDVYEPLASGPTPVDDGDRPFEYSDTSSESLREYLTWQMRLTPITETDQLVAEAIIDAVDDDGMLSLPLEEIHEGLLRELPELEFDEVEAVLHIVQSFDPPGVAGRDLRESLLIQLRQLAPDTPWLTETQLLLERHFDLLAKRDYNQLKRRLKLEEEDLVRVIRLVQSLNPRPGNQISASGSEYVVPDVIVRRGKDRWLVELNPETAPRLRINSHYASLIKQVSDSRDSTTMKNHLQEARWFIKSLLSRNETLLRVATAIVEHQRDFLEQGEVGMKAMVLHDIADELGLHESTISRVTTRKYMHTPRGVFELKYFFSSHVGTSDGGEASSTAIRALIKQLIGDENAAKPLSDSKIADLLAKQGIQVARRTVAKYREAMAIPPSNERKRLA